MQAILERWCYAPFATFGTLSLPDGWKCYTVERPWLNNEPFVSCIPVGTYPMRLDWHQRRYEVFELDRVPNRSQIQIHMANRAGELQGCIAPGRELGCVQGEWGVLDSRGAFASFMERMQHSRLPEILIQNSPNVPGVLR